MRGLYIKWSVSYEMLATCRRPRLEQHIRITQTSVTVPEAITWAEALDAFWSVVEQIAIVMFVRVRGM